MKHFILIRYNWKLYTENPYNIEDKDEYMTKRFPLFLRTCESLDNQTNQNFKAIVVLDITTPEKYLEPILEEVEKRGWFACYKHPAIFIKKELKIIDEWLITSRLDNDDEYYPEFVEVIQSEFRQKTEIIDVGFERVRKDTTITHNISIPISPFITLVEKHKEPHTVLCWEHTEAYHKYGGRKINRILAKQYIHGTNAYYERNR